MIQTLRKSVYKHGYLLIIAAWLYTLAFIFINYWSYVSSPKKIQHGFEQYISQSEKTFDELSKNAPALLSVISDTSKPHAEFFTISDRLHFYVYTTNAAGVPLLSFWNTNVVIPEPEDLQKADGKYFAKYPNGEFEFLKKTLRLNGKEIVVAGMVPLRRKYFWNNKYLRNEFAFNGLEKRYEPDTSGRGIAITNGDGKLLFRLKEKDKQKIIYSDYDALPLALKTIAVFVCLIFLNFLAYDTAKAHGWIKGIFLLISTIFILRFLSYHFDFPFDFRKLELFDPFIYASNILHPSLGDLLINTVLFFWIVSFLKLVSLKPISDLPHVNKTIQWVATCFLCMLLLVMAFTTANLIRSLIVDSKISFDISNFYSLNVYTFLSFIILCFFTLSFYHLSHIVYLLLKKCTEIPGWCKYLLISVFALLYLSLNLYTPALNSNLAVLLWLLLYLLILEYRQADLYLPFIRSSFFLIWLIFFSSSISFLIIFETRKIEIEQRKRIAEKLAMQTDPSGESLLSLAGTSFNNEFLSGNFPRFQSENSNKVIKDSLINENFSGYLNKYDTRIYTFDSSLNPLFNDDETSYELITNIIANQSKKTKIPDLYYYENSYDRFSYLFQKEIKDTANRTLGYFFVIAKPKRYKSEALYPELFKQVRDIMSDLNVNYAHAVYNKGQILISYGDHNFNSRLSKESYPHLEFEVRKYGDDNELWYNAGNNKIVVIVRKGSVTIESITLFAYLFGSSLFIILWFHLGNILLRSRFNLRRLKAALRFSIRTQIQTTIIFISVFSFVVIGVATISFYIDRFNKTNTERLIRVISMMASQIQAQLESHTHFDDAVEIYDTGASSELESTILEVSEIHNVDVNFYDVNGVLKMYTQPYIYNKHILSEMMEPVAYYNLHYNNEIKFIQKEKVGNFKYVSIYVPVKTADGKTYAYLNIPYLNSQNELNQEISNFLVTLINLNAFIFVLASIIALVLTNRIVRSFSLISSKMKDINLGKYNEKIIWSGNDEIGELVNEYNKMVKKLEESAEALAKSEREGAWREMARQVAHEIKNPLTPMKLSIQYLQRAINERKPGVQDLAKVVSATLIEQIDQLAKIASDFSQFANISNVKYEVFDVSAVLASLIDLHSTNEQVNIRWCRPPYATYINADRLQINRLFTNLLQNAIEASAHKPKAIITIEQKTEDNRLLISIADEGTGIPSDLLNKIFTPNFTTKTSGTGLGLAICKGIVEKAYGNIWFTTKENEGAAFYVTFPLAEKEE